MMQVIDDKLLRNWVPAGLLGWLEKQAMESGRSVEEEILRRLEESRQGDLVKKK